MDGLGHFSAFLLLFPEELTSREVLNFVIPHQVLGLSVLAASWPAQKEEDVRFRKEALGVGLNLHGGRVT